MRMKLDIISFIKYGSLSFIFLGLFIMLKWLFSDWEEIEKEKAYEHMLNCNNAYAFWQGVDGKSCDKARKTYHGYSEEEWRGVKKKLVDLNEITEQDYLYDELKKELEEEDEY